MNESASASELGLTSEEAHQRQQQFGRNELAASKKSGILTHILHVLLEPMFLLLLGAAGIYLILGEPHDAFVMLTFIVAMISIEVIQEWKTDRTLNALKDLSTPKIAVLRDGHEQVILSTELVPRDVMIIHEGIKIPADGTILQCNDLCVDESSLTGEPHGVWKTATTPTANKEGPWRIDYCYAGTLVIQGSARILVDRIGSATEYGKIGLGIAHANERPTPLEKQIAKLVKISGIVALCFFCLVVLTTWFNIPDHTFTDRVIESILSGIALALSLIPEELPVILAVFLSMGAWRLAKQNSLIRKLPAVETLGAVSVLCVDKTGTITLNQMTVHELWSAHNQLKETATIMGMACETETYDPMEKAMLAYCDHQGIRRDTLFGYPLIKEYPFTNELKMMGHIWQLSDHILLTAKGSPERLLPLCTLSAEERREAESIMNRMAQHGFRVIAVAQQTFASPTTVPDDLQTCRLTLSGLVALADPPRDSVKSDIETCHNAGIRVVMITGDNGQTAAHIARQVGISTTGNVLTGDQLNTLSDAELQEAVKETNIFSRVIPEHKMRIVQAFKANGHIVAMTGDGVNDAPALKNADIGIAMGKRGSEVSREAADLILMDDNFSTIVNTVRDARRIYDNIRKASCYVFTIHIPIALAAFIAPLLHIAPSNLLFLPVHVVLLEFIIDPTCSIVFERQPAERDLMAHPPRHPDTPILSAIMIWRSILQGVALFLASFGLYYVTLTRTGNAAEARSIALATLLVANLLLVYVNSSERDSILTTFRRLMHDRAIWAVNLCICAGLLTFLFSPLGKFLKLAPLTLTEGIYAVFFAACAVLWVELLKWRRRSHAR